MTKLEISCHTPVLESLLLPYLPFDRFVRFFDGGADILHFSVNFMCRILYWDITPVAERYLLVLLRAFHTFSHSAPSGFKS